MRIERHELLDQLYHFALGGSGMVIGIPGIGKSYLLRRLKEKLLENDILSFIVKIDNAYDSSDNAIAAELGIDGSWIETLSRIQLRNENKAVLIFDAFDAARDEEKRTGFLKQLKKARSLLKDKWNLIVSVRTYDANKSADLIQLFSQSDEVTGFAAARKISIGELSECEIQEASISNPILYKFYLDSTPEFKEILHVPFFLKILETVLSDYSDENLDAIKLYRSETQLLDFFWDRKIDATEESLLKQQFLQWFTEQLIERKTLSLPKNELIRESSSKQFEVFDYLRSENVVDEVAPMKSRVVYAHNIFFDYAVSRLCLDCNYESLLSFLERDYSRAFFLRPSFVYFFTSVWYDDPEFFWALYQQLSDNPRREIQLFVRLIINGTIATQFASTSELAKILDLNGTEKGDENIRNILQSIRFIRSKTLSHDISLLNYLSKSLRVQYLFEFAFLLDRAINDVVGELFDTVGESARELLAFILNNRESSFRPFLDRIGISRAVELVSKTFKTNPEESAKLLRRVLSLLDEPKFEIGYFSSLTDSIGYFVEVDPFLVGEIYKVIFGHRETSTEKTQMGASVVMSFTSDRRQDFEMCYYQLEQFFPTYISSSPMIATLTGIEIVNRAVIDRHWRSEHNQVFTFNYKGIECTFYSDYSVIWSDGYSKGQSEAIGDHIVSYIGKLFAEGQKEQASELVKAYITHAQVGFLWKLLIKLATDHSESMLDLILPLVLVPKFLSSTDVSYEVRAFLEKVNSLLTSEQIKAIEDTVFEAYSEDQEYGILAALSALDPKRIQSLRAREFMDGKKTMENVRPFQSSSSVTPYTTEDWLSDKGINIADPRVAELTQMVYFLDGFTHQFLNSTPNYQDYKAHLSAAIDLWTAATVENDLPEDLVYTMLNAATKAAAISSRNLNELPEEEFNLLKRLIVYAFNYVSRYDAGQDEKSAASGYSHTPRIAASEALPFLYVRDNDPELLSLYRLAMADANAIVRYNAIKNLPRLFNKHFEIYRSFLFERLQLEKDAFNYAVLLSAIHLKKEKVAEDGNAIILLINRHTQLFQEKNQFVESYAELLLWFLNEPNIPIAFETLVEGYKYPSLLNAVVFHLFKHIRTYEPEEVFVESIPSIIEKLKVINSYIEKAGQTLVRTTGITIHDPEVESALRIFDEIVMRLHFSLGSNQRLTNQHSLPAIEANRKQLFFLVKPLIEKILWYSSQITEGGLVIGHTAHYLIQTLNSVLAYDPQNILSMVAAITRYSIQVGYTFDSHSIRQIVSLTEKLFADHRDLLLQDQSFQNLLSILEIHVNSGWVDALELLWRLDEVFK